MSSKFAGKLIPATALVIGVLLTAAHADDAAKHVWTLPVNVSQALGITLETKATEELLKKASAQCVDEACEKQADACRAALATCVLVPSQASVHESEMENN